jgi:DNA-binding beta-propeller fold protein YncE
VIRYAAADGSSLGNFVAPGAGGLVDPRTLRFRSDGVLYVSSEGSDAILRYDRGGAFIDRLVSIGQPTGFLLSPFDGNVYVTDILRDSVTVFDGGTGARIRTLVRPGAGGLDGSVSMTFLDDPWLATGRIDPGVAGVVNTLTISNGTPNATHWVVFGTIPGSIPIRSCPHQYLGIADPLIVPLVADASGQIVMSDCIDPAASGLALLVQCLDLTGCQLSNLVDQTLQ